MIVYLVTVHTPLSERYTDSTWVVKERAEERCGDVKAEFARRGFIFKPDGWLAWMSEGSIFDGELQPKKDDLSPQSGK